MGKLNSSPIAGLHKFRFWCQKVLPLVYDDSLSYYEVVCKCVDYINQLIEDDKLLLADIQELRNDMTVVQQWIVDAKIEWVHTNINSLLSDVSVIQQWIIDAKIEWVHSNINTLLTNVSDIQQWITDFDGNKVKADIAELFNRIKSTEQWIVDFDGDAVKADISTLQGAVADLRKWVDDFDTSYAEQIIRDHLATMIFVTLNDAGYIVYHVPEQWSAITFNTTGLDIDVPLQPEYGHLVLSY